MRLIDADVFKTEYENLITWVSHRAEKARLREFIKDIQNQPTVEAIPISWINDYMFHMGNIFGPMDIGTMIRRYRQGFVPSVPEKGPVK